MAALAGRWHAADLEGRYILQIAADGNFVQRVTPRGGTDCQQTGSFSWYRGEKSAPSGRAAMAGADDPTAGVVVPMPDRRAIWVDVIENSCLPTAVGTRLEVLQPGEIHERLTIHLDRVGLAPPRNYRRGE